MTRDDIISLITDLSHSQGMYGRLLRDLMELKENDLTAYNDLMTKLESKKFNDSLDFIMWYEEGE